MSNADIPDDTIPFDLMGLLFFAYRDFVGEADEILAQRGFGRAHHRVLFFVNRHPGMKVADLLSILSITKQSLARVLKQLLEKGYIEQRTGTKDRRQRLLYPTNLGAELFIDLSKRQAVRVNQALDAIPKEMRPQIEQFLINMIEPDNQDAIKPYTKLCLEPA